MSTARPIDTIDVRGAVKPKRSRVGVENASLESTLFETQFYFNCDVRQAPFLVHPPRAAAVLGKPAIENLFDEQDWHQAATQTTTWTEYP